MKTTPLLLCLLLAGVTFADDGITLWGLTADNADSLLNVRVGYETKQRFEFGATAKYLTGNPEFGPEPDLFGGYLIYHINEILGIEDPAPDNPWEELLHRLVGRPYAGGEILISQKGEERARGNVIVGTLFGVADDPDYTVAFAVEYVTGDASDETVTIGARIKF